MMKLNFPQAVVFRAIDVLMFEKIDPSTPYDQLKAELIKYDDEIFFFKDSDIKFALSKWMERP